MTPSSTRADAGEEASTLSLPSTPVQAAISGPSGHYDLVPPNLKLASEESTLPTPAQIALTRGLSTQSNAGSIVPPSLGSSRVSQYDPSSTGSENPEKMMQDVSGISTPTSTPRADHKDLERDESVRGEGSVVGEGNSTGEVDGADLGDRLRGLNVGDRDRDPTPAPPSPTQAGHGGFAKAREVDGIVVVDDVKQGGNLDEQKTAAPGASEEPSVVENLENEAAKTDETRDKDEAAKEETAPAHGQSQAKTFGDQPHPNNLADPSAPSAEDARPDIPRETPEQVNEAIGPELDEDPNKASDLDDLKSGKLERHTDPSGIHTMDQNPINNLAEATMAQGIDEPIVPQEDLKVQGGVAGQRMEDVEKPTSIEPPKAQAEEYINDDGMDVHTATEPSRQADSQPAESTSTTHPREPTDMMPDVIEGKGAAGIPLSVADHAGSGPMTSGDTDKLKDLINEQRRKEHDNDEEAKEKNEQKNQGEKDPGQNLETEEDRDEGAPRKDVLVKALDQNKDTEKDLQEETNEQQREKARDVTSKMTEKLRGDDQKDEDAAIAEEEVLEKQAKEGNDDSEVAGLKGSGTADLSEAVNEMTIDDAATENDEKANGQDAAVTEEKEPIQVQVEPAPIAQPAETVEESEKNPAVTTTDQPQELAATDATKTLSSPPAFPDPPVEDPDVVDPVKSTTDTPAELADPVEATTPIDPTFLKAFPAVPDEEKPRVQVHVSQSPVASPLRKTQGASDPETPLAKLQGKSKSLSLHDLAVGGTEEGARGAGDELPEKDERRDSLDVDQQTPVGGQGKLSKRLSTRKSPKSPLLADEDPGDFEEGEGWAVVTQ